MQKLTNFFKYNNSFVIILGFLFLAAGSSFASETVRDAVIGQTIEEIKGMDNSALISADINSLKQEMSITDVSEDEENYYVAYAFFTFDIKDNAWQNQTKNQVLKIPKEALNGGKDLGLYVQSELAQVMDGHLAYLKDAQEKEQKKGITKIVKTVKYTGLKGLVLNSETKELDGYEPVIKKEERVDAPYAAPAAVISVSPITVGSSSSAESSSFIATESSSSSEPTSDVGLASSSSSSESSSSAESLSAASSESSASSESVLSFSSSSSEVASSSSETTSSLPVGEAGSSSSESSSSENSSASSSETASSASNSSESSI